MRKHESTHTGEKLFACTKFDKALNQSGTLKNHDRTHTGENPFPCSQCDKAFNDNGALNKHERTHTEEKPLRCFSFTQMKSHFPVPSVTRHLIAVEL